MFTADDIKAMQDIARDQYVNHEISADVYASISEDIKLAARRANVAA